MPQIKFNQLKERFCSNPHRTQSRSLDWYTKSAVAKDPKVW